jgi:hypothetical protein
MKDWIAAAPDPRAHSPAVSGRAPSSRPFRGSRPWGSTVVKTGEAAGVIAGIASGGEVERMAGNLRWFFSSVNERSRLLLKNLAGGSLTCKSQIRDRC